MLHDIISTLYGKNLACSTQINDMDIVSQVYKIEDRLNEWHQRLPPQMKLVVAKDIFAEGLPPASASNGIDLRRLRLRIVLTIRYLSVRILLHRPILVKFLEELRHSNDAPEMPMLLQIGTTNVQIAAKSGKELIYLVHNALRHAAGRSEWGLLGAWWSSLYYSKVFSVRWRCNTMLKQPFQLSMQP